MQIELDLSKGELGAGFSSRRRDGNPQLLSLANRKGVEAIGYCFWRESHEEGESGEWVHWRQEEPLSSPNVFFEMLQNVVLEQSIDGMTLGRILDD